MRIALVAPLVTPIAQPYIGGAQALVADLAQGLTRRQHSVSLFARAVSSIPGAAIEHITVPASVQLASFSDPSQERAADQGFLLRPISF